MPRDSNGTYSLPAGNPVVTLSVISSTWANTTLSDISTALTGSLDRSGQGAMLAGLKLFDGVIGSPGLTWGTDTTSGLYRNGAADFRFSISATDLLTLNPNLVQLSGTSPAFRISESDAAANNRLWDIVASGEELSFRVLTDALAPTSWVTIARTAGTIDAISFPTTATITMAGQGTFTRTRSAADEYGVQLNSATPTLGWFQTGAAANNGKWFIQATGEQFVFGTLNDAEGASSSWCVVDRTGTTVDTINFINGTLQYGGIEVGYRGFRQGRNFSGNDNTAATDAGGLATYTGSGGHTFTCDGDPSTNALVSIMNAGSGALTIAGSTSLTWFNGSGALSTGSRTLAVGGIATLWHSGGGNWNIWGTGLS